MTQKRYAMGSGSCAMQAICERTDNVSKSVDEKRQLKRFLGECLSVGLDIAKFNDIKFKELK